MSQERDSHFTNFAEMEFRDLTPHLANYLHALNEDNVLEMHRHEKTIKHILAQRAYDLVCHSQQFMPGVENVLDLTEWPE